MTEPLRRSKRQKTIGKYTEVSSYPDGPPSSAFENLVSTLDQQFFPSETFARIDDILTYSIFATKRKSQRYLALRPSCAFTGHELDVSAETTLHIAQLFETIRQKCRDSKQFGHYFTLEAKKSFSGIFHSALEESCFRQ